jgi:histone arginine demethylase JMJD6
MTVEEEQTRDIVLSSDERYDIWEIKRAERPHLLKFEGETLDDDYDEEEEDDGNNHKNDNKDDNSVDGHDHDGDSCSPPSPTRSLPRALPLPHVDGCDLRGWRHSRVVKISEMSQGYLNVGSGCPLTRLESQLPVLPSRALARWRALQTKLLQPPDTTALRIPEEEATKLPWYPWFEKENIPVILEGLTKTWQAMESCKFERLVANFGDHEWRFSDTHGKTMMLRTFRKYVHSIEGQSDDAPLAVYDSQLDSDERMCLLDDYNVPQCFASPDLFACLGDEDRPPYRWILIGPARSGTGLHIDPLGTHAWVTLLEGTKRWVLFPYGTDRAMIGMQDPQIPSALWFAEDGGWYHRAMEQVPGAVEILQHPGETVYVPAGWPHLVLNLEFSTAITQNYATEYPSLQRISRAVQEEEPSMFVRWKEKLFKTRSDLMDECDGQFGEEGIRVTTSISKYRTQEIGTGIDDGTSSPIDVATAFLLPT